ncbi:unnamed protein product [Polarella glacialis]|uniref:PARP n=1 Tax=Polarella glacialis TaxID=89957 RepID=A0A813FPI3_POLGL|nr:unnamed protein product [Polarella glacialis]
MVLTWNEFLTSSENGSLSDEMLAQVEEFFVTAVGAVNAAAAEGFNEADLEKVKLPEALPLRACVKRTLRAVDSVYAAKRMKRQAMQNGTGPTAVGSTALSEGAAANFLAPPLVKTADEAFHFTCRRTGRCGMQFRITTMRRSYKGEHLYIELTSKDVLPHWVPIDSVGGRIPLKGEDDVQLTGNQNVATLNALTKALRSATDNTRFFRPVPQWMNAFLRYAAVAVCFGHLPWPQIISHVDVIMQLAEVERTKGRPAYAAFVYDDLVRKNFARHAEKKDSNLDIGKEIQTVNKELLEQVQQLLESVLTAAGMNNNSSSSGSQANVADAADSAASKQLAAADVFQKKAQIMGKGAAMLKGQGKGGYGKGRKEDKEGKLRIGSRMTEEPNLGDTGISASEQLPSSLELHCYGTHGNPMTEYDMGQVASTSQLFFPAGKPDLLLRQLKLVELGNALLLFSVNFAIALYGTRAFFAIEIPNSAGCGYKMPFQYLGPYQTLPSHDFCLSGFEGRKVFKTHLAQTYPPLMGVMFGQLVIEAEIDEIVSLDAVAIHSDLRIAEVLRSEQLSGASGAPDSLASVAASIHGCEDAANSFEFPASEFQFWLTRIVDLETESGANPATRPFDKISHDTLNALATMILLLFQLGVDSEQWKRNVSKAFRRVPVFWQHREFAGVIWVQLNVVWVAQHKGMPFGAVSAAYAWHRVGHALLVVLLRLFLAPAAQYVDDFFGANKAGVTWTAGRCLSVFSKLVCFPTEDSKDADHMTCMVVLGAESKIDWPSRQVGARVDPCKAKKWINYLLAMLDDERLLAGDASKMAGNDAAGASKWVAAVLWDGAKSLYTRIITPEWLWDQVLDRGDNQIGFQELLGVILAWGTFSHVLQGAALWTAYVDNDGVLHALANGGGGGPESNRELKFAPVIFPKVWSEVNLRSFITWSERADSDELNEALGIVFVINRSRWDGVATNIPAFAGRSCDKPVPEWACHDVGCKRCISGQGGFKREWPPGESRGQSYVPEEWEQDSIAVLEEWLQRHKNANANPWASGPADLYDLNQVAGAKDYLGMMFWRFRAAAAGKGQPTGNDEGRTPTLRFSGGPAGKTFARSGARNIFGFLNFTHLEGLLPDQTAGWGRTEAESALMIRGVRTANHDASCSRLARLLKCSDLEESQPLDASGVAEALTKDNMITLDLDISQRLPPDFESSPRPRQRTACLAEASSQQDDVLPALEDRVLYLKMMPNLRSMPSVASGLRSWHAFAVNVLHYDEENTLPPKCSQHIAVFAAVRSNAGTVRNYVNHASWACKLRNLSLNWMSDEVEMVLQGLQKECIVKMPSALGDKMLLTELLVQQLVTVADGRGNSELSVFMLRAWEFLMRVQSKRAALQTLSLYQHTGIVPCLWTASLQLTFVFGGANTGRKARYLSMLGVAGASQFTMKCFRAGKATALAQSGAPVHLILQRGEWKSAAVLSYADADAWDRGALLAASIEVYRERIDRSEGLALVVDYEGYGLLRFGPPTVLHFAAGCGSLEVCKAILARAGRLNFATDAAGQTPLFWAAQSGLCATVELLRQSGADAAHADSEGSTALHLAAGNGCPRLCGILLRGEAHLEVVRMQTNCGLTPLHLAAQYGYADVARVLLEVAILGQTSDAVLRLPGPGQMHLPCQLKEGSGLPDVEGMRALDYALERGWAEPAKSLRAEAPSELCQMTSLHITAPCHKVCVKWHSLANRHLITVEAAEKQDSRDTGSSGSKFLRLACRLVDRLALVESWAVQIRALDASCSSSQITLSLRPAPSQKSGTAQQIRDVELRVPRLHAGAILWRPGVKYRFRVLGGLAPEVAAAFLGKAEICDQLRFGC